MLANSVFLGACSHVMYFLIFLPEREFFLRGFSENSPAPVFTFENSDRSLYVHANAGAHKEIKMAWSDMDLKCFALEDRANLMKRITFLGATELARKFE